MKEYLRTKPSDDLIMKAAKSIGLSSLSESKWVSEKDLDTHLMCEVLGEMSDLYYPCHTITYIEKKSFSYKDYMVIIRQLFRYKNLKITSRQTSKALKKHIYHYYTAYSIENPLPLPQPVKKEYVVSFDD